jgi:hypothetical protein
VDDTAGNVNKSYVMDSETISLLKEEYFHIHKTVEDFDQRALAIKAWSVTASMVGIAVSFLYENANFLNLLAAIASLSFWITEALWKGFQQCYYLRIRELEDDFANKVVSKQPLRINKSWSQAFASYDLKKFIQILTWYHVMLPHVLIIIGGILIWIIRLTQKS